MKSQNISTSCVVERDAHGDGWKEGRERRWREGGEGGGEGRRERKERGRERMIYSVGRNQVGEECNVCSGEMISTTKA